MEKSTNQISLKLYIVLGFIFILSLSFAFGIGYKIGKELNSHPIIIENN
ncbi:MAG TPA: hypothetical protein VI432_00705 [Candidatus Paceibacterota bacterium]